MADVIEFVSCLTWIKKGVSRTLPEKITLTKGDLAEIVGQPGETQRQENISESGDEYNFADYDHDIDPLDIRNVVSIDDEDIEEDDSDDEDDRIKESDNLLVVGASQQDSDILDVYVFNYDEGEFYVHHNIVLKSCPLSLEWLDYESQNESGNLIAVGQIAPEIEIWDLDIINPFEPVCKLGFKAASKKHAHRNFGHKKAVLSLSWNPTFSHIMASGSADKTVILWDLDSKKPSTTIKSFEGNVESILWHPHEGQILLGGSADGTVKVLDCRYSDSYTEWSFEGEINDVKWNTSNLFYVLAGSSKGSIHYIDVRSESPVWSTEATDSDVTGLNIVNDIPGMMVASHVDGSVRVWDIRQASPYLVTTIPGKVEKIHCFGVCPEHPHIGAFGGTKKKNTLTLTAFNQNEEVRQHWKLPAKEEGDHTNTSTD